MHRLAFIGVTTIAAVTAVTAVTAVALLRSDPNVLPVTVSPDARTVSASPQRSAPQLVPSSRAEVGSFRFASGKMVRVAIGSLRDGSQCLIEEGAGGQTRACQEGGLFATRRAELMVGSEGGPDHFDQLHVIGIVAPSVRSAVLAKTDGTSVRLALNAQKAFFYESPTVELDADVYPTAVELYGPSGRLVGTVEFPPAG